MKEAFVTSELDNVATSFEDIETGEDIHIFNLSTGESIQIKAKSKIPFGNKVAIYNISNKEKIVKYGYDIGVAIRPIESGEVVHVMNIDSMYAPIPTSVRTSVLHEYNRRFHNES